LKPPSFYFVLTGAVDVFLGVLLDDGQGENEALRQWKWK
jgi:hypothetical protein